MKIVSTSAVLAAALAALAPALHAKGDAARLMLKLPDGSQPVEIVKVSEGAVELPGGVVSIDQPVTPDAWAKVSITVKSPANVDALLRLSATWTKEDSVWVYIDDIKYDGDIPLNNPDLEDGAPGKAPTGWKFTKTGEKVGEYLQDATLATSGAGLVKVPFSAPLAQTIHLPEGKEVTISFSAKLAPAN